MAADGKWELVGATKKKANGDVTDKKNKKDVQSNTKGNKQTAIATPKLKEGSRSLHKFKISMDVDEGSNDEDDIFKKDAAVPVQAKSQKTTNKKSVPARPKTLKDAVTKLNLSELQSLVKALRSQFSDSLIWLKDIASFLNVRLNPSTPVDSAYRQEASHNAPLDYVALPIREFLVRMVQGCSVDVLSAFHRHCFTCMLHEAMRGLPVHGFAIFIQVISNVCRDACVVYSKDYVSLRTMYTNHPRPGLTFVWLLSNTITSAASARHYAAAVTMWTEGLMPLVGSKQFSSLSVQCGRDMVSRMEGLYQANAAAAAAATAALDKKTKPSNGIKQGKPTVVVTATQLIELLEITCASTTQIPRTAIKQLSDIFNKLKVLCATSSTESSTLFQRLLPRLTSSCPPTMAQQIASVCSCCLQSNETKSWNVWHQLLPKHQLQSAKLLRLIASDDTTSKVLASPTARRALQAFEYSSAKQGADNAQARELSREVKRAISTVATLASKPKSAASSSSNAPSAFWRTVRRLLCLMAVLAAVGYGSVYLYDNSDTFDDMLIGKLAAKAGLTTQVQQAVEKMATATLNFKSKSASSYEHVAQVLQPYLTVLHTWAAQAKTMLCERYPDAATALARLCLRGEVALYQAVDVAAENMSALLASDHVVAAVELVSNYTEQLMAALHAALHTAE